ncbi:MAG: RraA family protein [Chloroflexi bacterium]|nr:RraA family protein [Chloroflexota bacterium]MCY4247699.1 RraA family protein [Chloroflexota bacterium]
MHPGALDKLRQYDTATVCNVIDLFEVRPRNRGFMRQRVKAAFPDLPPMVGFASTVTCRTVTKPPDCQLPIVPDLISRWDELDGPAVVVMQNLDAHGAAAIFGDVLCHSFAAFGATGLVTDGQGRDFAGIASLGLPVFCAGIVCAHGYMHLLTLHEAVQVGGIAVQPNTLLHGDANGVTTIPGDIAADVADVCAEYVEAEAVVIAAAQTEAANLAALRAAYADMAGRIAKLNARLRKRGGSA